MAVIRTPKSSMTPYIPSNDNLKVTKPSATVAISPYNHVCGSRQSARRCSSSIHNNDGSKMTALPTNFIPGPFDVICARGSEARKHIGNVTFRERIKESAHAYAAAESKLFKSLVVSKVVKWFRERSVHGGGFVKKVDDIWYEIGDHLARERPARLFVIVIIHNTKAVPNRNDKDG